MAIYLTPQKQINWDEFDKLVSYQCTQEEIAAFFDISLDTLENICLRDKGIRLSELWDKKKYLGRVKLRKIQFQIAESGGPGATAMAIFLGKAMLNQSDKELENRSLDDHNQLKTKKIKTFFEFCEAAGYPIPFEKQIEMKDFGIKESVTRMLLGSRGYGKTDYVSILGIAYEIYELYMQGLFTSNLIITKTLKRSSSIVQEIANALLNNGVELEKNNASFIRVKGQVGKDHTVEGMGLKSSLRSRHPKRVVMDDVVTEEDTSEPQRLLAKKKYDEAYKLTSNILIIGQPAHPLDLHSELRPIIKKMEVPHGSIPELDADLEAMKLAGIDPVSIEMSYHLRIPTEGNSIFSNLKFIPKMPEGDKVAFIDPSDGGDFTAVSIFQGYFSGIAVEGRAYKKAWYHCLDELAKYLIESGVKRIAFETNATGNQPVGQLRQIFSKYGIGVVGIHSTSEKHKVIAQAGSFAHMIHLSQASDKNYTNQVIRYEYKAKHDDGPDSLARGLVWLGLLKE